MQIDPGGVQEGGVLESSFTRDKISVDAAKDFALKFYS